jgi:predicted N-acetyltransferase YhbS
VEHYKPGNRDGNFFLPTWEYMLTHPYFKDGLLDKFGVWEDEGRIVGVVHPESVPAEAFFEIRPDYPQLKAEMLSFAEEHGGGKGPDGRMCVLAFINDFDMGFEALAKSRGFEIFPAPSRPMAQLPIPRPFPPVTIPEGFRLQSLADDNNLAQITRVLWRGFNHGDEPPDESLADRRKMQSAPHYRKDLNIVAVAPDGNYVSYAGLWFEDVNKFAYVEPICTDPDYRRRGLAKAAILEGIRRCGELGATVAYVGSTLPIYQNIGFKKLHTCNCWRKFLEN